MAWLVAAWLVAACGEAAVTGPVVSQLLLEVSGDFGAYALAEVVVEGRVVEVGFAAGGLAATVDDVAHEELDIELRLIRETELLPGGQRTTRFDSRKGLFEFRGGLLEVALDQFSQPLSMLALSRPEGTAFLRDDPCVLETRVETTIRSLDADRALYGGTFEDLRSFVFVEDGDYAGGNVFEGAADRTFFDTTCEGGDFELADTLICLHVGDVFHCLFHAWS